MADATTDPTRLRVVGGGGRFESEDGETRLEEAAREDVTAVTRLEPPEKEGGGWGSEEEEGRGKDEETIAGEPPALEESTTRLSSVEELGAQRSAITTKKEVSISSMSTGPLLSNTIN